MEPGKPLSVAVSDEPALIILVGAASTLSAKVADLIKETPGCKVVCIAPDEQREETRDPLAGQLGVPDLRISLVCGTVAWQGEDVACTEMELLLLARMNSDPSRIWTFADLHKAIGNSGWTSGLGGLRACISRLRQKLAVLDNPLQIVSVRGKGYRLRFATSAFLEADKVSAKKFRPS